MQKQKTTTITEQDAAFVSRRLLGDLLSVHEDYGMESWGYFVDLAHDLELGLYHECVSKALFMLYKKDSTVEEEILVYTVEDREFTPSSHSGRLPFNADLVGGWFNAHVTKSAGWDDLETKNKFRLNWTPRAAPSTAGMTAASDGGYSSGALRVSRTAYRRS